MPNCPNCGKPLADNAKFCNECGAKITDSQNTTATPKPVENKAPINNNIPPQNGNPNAQYNNIPPQNGNPNAQYNNMPPRNDYYQNPQGYAQPYIPMQGYPIKEEPSKRVASVGSFFGFSFLFGIPVIGLIITIIMACGAGSNDNIKNYARAQLIWTLIGVLLVIIFYSTIVSFLSNLLYSF